LHSNNFLARQETVVNSRFLFPTPSHCHLFFSPDNCVVSFPVTSLNLNQSLLSITIREKQIGEGNTTLTFVGIGKDKRLSVKLDNSWIDFKYFEICEFPLGTIGQKFGAFGWAREIAEDTELRYECTCSKVLSSFDSHFSPKGFALWGICNAYGHSLSMGKCFLFSNVSFRNATFMLFCEFGSFEGFRHRTTDTFFDAVGTTANTRSVVSGAKSFKRCPTLDAGHLDLHKVECYCKLPNSASIIPDREADHPVLWVSTTDIKAPHGQTVKLN
jgi:hypothetical protein